jgi:hypothetical protein
MNTQELIAALKNLRGKYVGDGINVPILTEDIIKQLEEYHQFKSFIKHIVKE